MAIGSTWRLMISRMTLSSSARSARYDALQGLEINRAAFALLSRKMKRGRFHPDNFSSDDKQHTRYHQYGQNDTPEDLLTGVAESENAEH